MEASLATSDFIIFAGAILATALIGLRFTQTNRTLDSYMRADGELSVLPVALSLMSSSMSGLSMIGSSAEIFYQGASFSLICFSMLATGPIAATTILPVFYEMKQLSLHKYLEQRFGSSTRHLISVVYMSQAIIHTAVILYLPCLALETMLGFGRLESMLAIGTLCVLYSTLGGIRAVIWTDAFLGLLMLSSLLALVSVGTYDAGGLGRVLARAAQGKRLQLDGFFQFSLTARHTILGIALGATIKGTYAGFVNQAQMQRLLSLPSLRQAQWALVLASILTASISLLSTYLGLVVYSAYRDCDPYLAGQISRRDSLSIHYLVSRMSRIPGIQGLFAAGLVSGALSSVSSFSNSMAALIIEDFVKPIRKSQLGGGRAMLLAKLLSCLAGILCLLLACAVDKSGSRLLQTIHLLSGALGVPILAAFAVGLFSRSANYKGLVVGLLLTFSLGGYLSYEQTFRAKPLEPSMPVYYNQQCGQIFNRSTSLEQATELADQLPPGRWIGPQPAPPLKLENLSYLVIPIVTFSMMILVTLVISLVTGGDQPEERLLLKCLRRRPVVVDVERRRKIGVSHCDGFEESA